MKLSAPRVVPAARMSVDEVRCELFVHCEIRDVARFVGRDARDRLQHDALHAEFSRKAQALSRVRVRILPVQTR